MHYIWVCLWRLLRIFKEYKVWWLDYWLLFPEETHFSLIESGPQLISFQANFQVHVQPLKLCASYLPTYLSISIHPSLPLPPSPAFPMAKVLTDLCRFLHIHLSHNRLVSLSEIIVAFDVWKTPTIICHTEAGSSLACYGLTRDWTEP